MALGSSGPSKAAVLTRLIGQRVDIMEEASGIDICTTKRAFHGGQYIIAAVGSDLIEATRETGQSTHYFSIAHVRKIGP